MKRALYLIVIILAIIAIFAPIVIFAINAMTLELAFLFAVCGVFAFLLTKYLAADIE